VSKCTEKGKEKGGGRIEREEEGGRKGERERESKGESERKNRNTERAPREYMYVYSQMTVMLTIEKQL